MNPAPIAPIARLMGAGDVVDRSDLQYERYRTAAPGPDVAAADPHARASTPPVDFGPPTPNVAGPKQPMIDEVALGHRPDAAQPAAGGQLRGDRARRRSCAPTPPTRPLLVAGDADGLVDAAGARPARRSAGRLLLRLLRHGPSRLRPDLRRRTPTWWSPTPTASGPSAGAPSASRRATPSRPTRWRPYDPTDQRLEVFPDADHAPTRPSPSSAAAPRSTATDYGNPVTYTPDDRPANAMDGDPQTRLAGRARSTTRPAQRLDHRPRPAGDDRPPPAAAAHQPGAQPLDHQGAPALRRPDAGDRRRWTPRRAPSRARPSTSRTQTFHHLEIEVLRHQHRQAPRVRRRQRGRLRRGQHPRRGNGRRGGAPADRPARPGPAPRRSTTAWSRCSPGCAPTRPSPCALDEELRMNRLIDLPTARSFSIDRDGRAVRLRARRHDRPACSASPTPPTAASPPPRRATCQGSIEHARLGRARRRPDHVLERRVQPGRPAPGCSTTSATRSPSRTSTCSSWPTAATRCRPQLTIEPDGDPAKAVKVDIPPVDRPAPSPTRRSPCRSTLPASVTGQVLRFTVTGARRRPEKDWYSNSYSQAPVAIAELGIPGEQMARRAPTTFDSGCRSDLVTIDGRPVPVRVTGTTADAVARKLLTVSDLRRRVRSTWPRASTSCAPRSVVGSASTSTSWRWPRTRAAPRRPLSTLVADRRRRPRRDPRW